MKKLELLVENAANTQEKNRKTGALKAVEFEAQNLITELERKKLNIEMDIENMPSQLLQEDFDAEAWVRRYTRKKLELDQLTKKMKIFSDSLNELF